MHISARHCRHGGRITHGFEQYSAAICNYGHVRDPRYLRENRTSQCSVGLEASNLDERVRQQSELLAITGAITEVPKGALEDVRTI